MMRGAGLVRLWARGVGPFQSLDVELAPRLNVLSGDNGLGKTFVLDLAWFELTGSWATVPLLPRLEESGKPLLGCTFHSPDRAVDQKNDYSFEGHHWNQDDGFEPPLTIYARADGSVSVWDDYRIAETSWRTPADTEATSRHFSFSPSALWDGLTSLQGKPLSNGLIHDWNTWRYQRPELFELFSRVLAKLSPGEPEALRVGPSRRLSLDDVRDIPTLQLPYGEVPITHASAAMRRILGLAYILVWTWHEHLEASRLRKIAPKQDLILLIDEVEAHLHPQWQRVILPALFQVIPELQRSLRVQVVVSTHAPLVLASIEPIFREGEDRLLHFKLNGSQIEVETLPWSKQGDAVNWLVSETFGLEQARSREAERAIEAAERFMRGEPNAPELSTHEQIHEALVNALPAHDAFWPRWLVETGAVE